MQNKPEVTIKFTIRPIQQLTMLRRAWTMVIGYLVTYSMMTFIYQGHDSVKKFFPAERIPYLLIGFVFYLYGLTEVSTWIIRKTSLILQKYVGDQIITENPIWLGCEILWWFFVANFSILTWAALGDFYNGEHRKMFAFGMFLAGMTEYINGQYMPE